MVRDAGLSTETNIGPNTRPETFTFSHNLWFHNSNPNWSGPSIPTPDPAMIVNQNPMLANPEAGNGDCHIPVGSPAAGAGLALTDPERDYYGYPYSTPRSIGAAQAVPPTSVAGPGVNPAFFAYPNPFSGELHLKLPDAAGGRFRLRVFGPDGRLVAAGDVAEVLAGAGNWPEGLFVLVLENLEGGAVYRCWVMRGVK